MSTHQIGFRYCGVLSVYCIDDHRSINYPWLGLWRMSNPKTAQTVNSDEFLLCLHLFPLFVCSSCPPVFHMAQCGPINPVSYSIGVPVESSQGPTQQISPIFFPGTIFSHSFPRWLLMVSTKCASYFVVIIIPNLSNMYVSELDEVWWNDIFQNTPMVSREDHGFLLLFPYILIWTGQPIHCLEYGWLIV